MKRIFVCFLALVALFAGCKNDLDTNADWKEILVIYSLLSTSDTTHYVRVNRAFLSENQSALEIAKRSDSLQFDSLDVKILETDNGGGVKNVYQLNWVVLDKDTGIFASEDNRIFTFDAVLNKDYIYKLIVTNKLTGNVATAQTALVDKAQPGSISGEIDTVKFYRVSLTAGRNAKVYDVIMRFHWNEYDSATNTLIDSSYIDWPVGTSREVVNNQVINNVPGNVFYTYLAAFVPGITGKYRVPTHMDFYFWGADSEYFIYHGVNKPSIGIVQKKPEYTNISSGNYGLFASRNLYKVVNVNPTVRFKGILQTYGATRHLKFRQ
ncbi:MAG TPA: hypothetical protein VEC12_06445 [Bacteroidia bacterium]|nr:hypothetical protein [Bacteroidia bacterium]